jgi:protein TonB
MAVVCALALLIPPGAHASDRKIKAKAQPDYPELAKRMSVTGTVKLSVTVAPSGSVTNVKVIGGHPLLINAAVDAAKRFKFEPSPDTTTEEIDFKFGGSE